MRSLDWTYVVAPAVLVVLGLGVAVVCVRVARARGLALRAALWLTAFASVAVAFSSGLNAVLLHHYRASPPGTLYTVNGRTMRLLCMGSGSPSLVLDSGLGGDGLGWSGVQPVLAKTTRVCSYDRAGYGWSDPGPAPRDAEQIAGELHGLLQAAHIDGPLVLMGHSLGGIYMRAYASRYPEHVAGLVFVDSSTPWQDRNPAFTAEMARSLPSSATTLRNEVAYALGIPRWRGTCTRDFAGVDARTARLAAESACHVSFATIAGEGANFDRSGTETIHSGPYGALPVLILSQDPAKTAGTSAADLGKAWNQMQEDLKKLSTRSRRVIARGSGHGVHIDRPDLIEQVVPGFIREVRSGVGAGYGTTVME